MFTRDPVNGARKFVVGAALGLSEGVVTGEVPADHLDLDPSSGRLLSSRVVSKDTMVVVRDTDGVEQVPVSPSAFAAYRRWGRVQSPAWSAWAGGWKPSSAALPPMRIVMLLSR